MGVRPAFTTKSGLNDLVSEYFERAAFILVDGLMRTFPDDGFVGTIPVEHQDFANADNETGPTWRINALDGETNFAQGLPLYAVSIALTFNAQPLMGVVFAPAYDWLFDGVVGMGLRRNGEPVRVSDIDTLTQSMLSSGQKHWDVDGHTTFAEYAALASRARGIQRLGCPSLEMAFVACGYFEGYWGYDVEAFDAAAGSTLVLAGGGWVSALDGEYSPFHPGQGSRILATNGRIHEDLGNLLGQYGSPPHPPPDVGWG